MILTAAALSAPLVAAAQPAGPLSEVASTRLNVYEFVVQGATLLEPGEVENAVYPFLGPGKTTEDVEQARASLEALYVNQGYQAVQVTISPMPPGDGVVKLLVTETKIGRLRVRGARYLSPSEIKAAAPSLAEGKVLNVNEAEKDLVALNQIPDRVVTPAIRAGVAPGTIDVDLNVDDAFPLHGSVELNNRKSPNTEPLRLSTSVRYDNLWQLGHSITFSNVVAPQRPDDSLVYSGSYLARFPTLSALSFLVFGFKSDSDVATVGGAAVIGKGQSVGGRVIAQLPSVAGVFQTVSGGVDWKNFDEVTTTGGGGGEVVSDSPVTYYPFTIGYTAGRQDENSSTQAGADVVFTFRGIGTDDRIDLDNKRFNASGSFIILRGNAAHTQTLPYDAQLFVRVDGQAAEGALFSNEQFALGGLDSVRGFFEAAALGDYGVNGTFEVRSPSAGRFLSDLIQDWRLHLFVDGGFAAIYDPLPDQTENYRLVSWGAGSRVQILERLHGSVDFGFPLQREGLTDDDETIFVFRVWGDI